MITNFKKILQIILVLSFTVVCILVLKSDPIKVPFLIQVLLLIQCISVLRMYFKEKKWYAIIIYIESIIILIINLFRILIK